MSKAVAMQAWAIVKCQSRSESVMAGGGGRAAGTCTVDQSSRARYTGRYINISILAYQKQKIAYPVFDTGTLSVHWQNRLTVCRRLLVQILFAPYGTLIRNGMYWDVLGCTGMYWYVQVYTNMYWYVLVCTECFGMNLYVLVHTSMYMYILVCTGHGMYCT